jgi:hypothetical protein
MNVAGSKAFDGLKNQSKTQGPILPGIYLVVDSKALGKFFFR